MTRIAVLLSTLLALAACSDGDDDGAFEISGPNGATSLEAAGLMALGTCAPVDVTMEANGQVLMFSTAPGICGDLAAAVTPSSSTTAFLALYRLADLGGSVSVLAPETFTVIPRGAALPPAVPSSDGVVRGPTVAFVTVERMGAACGAEGLSEGVSGTVTIRDFRIEDGQLLATMGSANVQLDDGGRITGSFEVPMCPTAARSLRADCSPTAIPVDTTCE